MGKLMFSIDSTFSRRRDGFLGVGGSLRPFPPRRNPNRDRNVGKLCADEVGLGLRDR